jgi:Icc-related predicted phosphoesterase
MKIALFADLHGRILLAFKLIERLQRERNIQVDLILQCGDLGIFPNPHQLDKATQRHAARDTSELGFSTYFLKPNQQTDRVLANVGCKMIGVRGNHEDHLFLNELEKKSTQSIFSVDAYERVFICKSGHLQTFQLGEESFNFVGIGRIGNYKLNQSKDEKYIQTYEKEQIQHLGKKVEVDILISHDSALHFMTNGFGMSEIRKFLNDYKPFYHFFGHTGHPFTLQKDENNFTESCKIKELEFESSGALPEGAFVLLDWKNQLEHQLEVIEDAWIKEYTKQNWEYL